MRNARWLAFGFLLIFSSNFGQTFFIGLFSGELRAAFDLSHADFGTLYSLATLASAALLIWTGPLIDRIDLAAFVAAAIGLLIAGIFVMASATHVAMLAVAIFLLRHGGQGLMTHAGQTSMVRYFHAGRGRALSLAGMGMALGEGMLPGVAVALIALIGWRTTWVAAGAFAGLVSLPLLLLLLRSRKRDILPDDAPANGTGGEPAAPQRHWTRAEALGDPRFYAVMAGMMGFAFIVTGLFVHQAHVAEAKGWGLELVARAFVAYAVASVATALVVGVAVDWIGAKRLMPLYPVPLAASMAVLALGGGWPGAVGYFAFAGMGAGATLSMMMAVWAELYGTRHIGSVRAVVMALVVFASAVSPLIMGAAFDRGVGVGAVAWVCFFYLVAASLVSLLVLTRR